MLLIFLGWELHVLYHCTMCTRHLDHVSFAFPIFYILICRSLHLLVYIRTPAAFTYSVLPCQKIDVNMYIYALVGLHITCHIIIMYRCIHVNTCSTLRNMSCLTSGTARYMPHHMYNYTCTYTQEHLQHYITVLVMHALGIIYVERVGCPLHVIAAAYHICVT